MLLANDGIENLSSEIKMNEYRRPSFRDLLVGPFDDIVLETQLSILVQIKIECSTSNIGSQKTLDMGKVGFLYAIIGS